MILIKDMEMPKTCGECRFSVDGWCYAIASNDDQPGYIKPYEKAKWCPLIGVPEDVQPMKWIPVTERLPDFDGMCLCMRKSYSKANFRHQEIMYFDYDEQAFCSNTDGVFVADGNVTHWMPLPEPPEECET